MGSRIAVSALVLLAASHAAAQVPLDGRWQGTISRARQDWPVRIDLVRDAGRVVPYLDFPGYGLYYRLGRIEQSSDSVRITYVSGRDTVVFSGTQRDSLLAGAWNGLGLSATFSLHRVGDAPPRLGEQDVRFTNGAVTLAGRLVTPAGSGPWPVVVWTHGSGRQSRDADFYRDRAYLLAQHGVAGLIYDKRGVGASTGDPDATLDELAGDAVAAIDFLAGRRDIDGRHIGVAGFSQGGYVAPLAAVRSRRVAFVAVGSAPGVSPVQQNDYAALSALRRLGVSTDTIEQAMRLRADVERFQRTGEDRQGVEAALTAVRSQRWFRAADLPVPPLQQLGARGLGVLDFDPLSVWRRVRVPVLAIWGADDRSVPAERSRAAIEAALPPATRTQTTIRIFPHASHGLLLDPPPGAAWDWPRLAPGFHDLLTEWIVGRAHHTPTDSPPRTP